MVTDTMIPDMIRKQGVEVKTVIGDLSVVEISTIGSADGSSLESFIDLLAALDSRELRNHL